MTAVPAIRTRLSSKTIGWSVALAAGLVFLVLAGRSYSQANYTFLIATAILDGHLGLNTGPAWLNELVPMGGHFYSVFPLGAVLSVLPFSLLVWLRLLGSYPADWVVALLAAGCAGLAYCYTYARRDLTQPNRALLGLWLVGGTWFMTNLLFSGAWQIALGLAVLGELIALVFTVVRPRPVLAGLGFAIAFGNRTELLLLAPILAWLLIRSDVAQWRRTDHWQPIVRKLAGFCAVPLLLGLATLWYNHARFGSWTDFGYTRIPGVMNLPLLHDGLFSFTPVAKNAQAMLFQGWKSLPAWPYWVPDGFGGSIVLASPFLLLVAQPWRGDRLKCGLAVIAIIVTTAALWAHGDPGGWQYSYRYALELLPWFLVIFVELLPTRVRPLELGLWLVSVVVSGYATYLFLWTNYVHP
ncbi:MAG: hypothetical protein ACRDQU_13650 [Pseudonocardiaceae bacterium]